MIGVLFLCWISTRNAFSQNVAWTVGTSVPKCNEDLRLVCTVDSNCCNSHNRIWESGTGTIILNDGASSSPNKYVEDWNGTTSGFTLIIKNLQASDVGVDYNCRYGLNNDKHALTRNANWECPPTESCSFAYNPAVTMIEITGTLNITKAAPSPVITAYYGEDNLTRYLSSTGVSNYDTWYYTLTVSTDKQIDCLGHLNDKFKLYAITGTTSTKICDIDMCECLRCFGICFFTNWSFGILGIIISMVYCCIFCGEECEKQKLIKMAVLYGIITVIASLIVGLPMGLYGCICNEYYFYLFALLISIVCCCIAIVIIDKIFYKITWSDFKDNKIQLVLGLFGGIAIFIILNKLYKVIIQAIIGENRRLPCPFADASGQITWVKLNGNVKETYSEGTVLNQHLPQRLRERLNVEGRDLCISNVQESDTGIYECVFTSKKANKVPEGSKLKLIVSAGKEKKPTPV